MQLKGKVAFITGGARGARRIGKDIALAFAGDGANVAMGDLDLEVAEACARELDATGLRVIGLGVDVTDEAQVEAATARVVEAFGALDVLVNVVGVPPSALAAEIEPLEWKRLLAIQLDCAFVATRAALRRMHRQGRGSIVYVGWMPPRSAAHLAAPYARLRRGLTALASAVERDGAALGVRATTVWCGPAARAEASIANAVSEAVALLARPAAAPSVALPHAPRSTTRQTRRNPDDRIGCATTADRCADHVLELATALLPMSLCTLERVARQLGVDPRTLQRRLARHGTSFGDIVDDLRADQAARYLRDSNLSLTEVAEALGFSALSAFSRWFRQRFGCSATSWRRVALAPASD